MGYFANCIEAMDYQQQYCTNCVHWNDDYECPCLEAHEFWGYKACNNDESILNKMIPRDEDGNNQQCIFFVRLSQH